MGTGITLGRASVRLQANPAVLSGLQHWGWRIPLQPLCLHRQDALSSPAAALPV